MNAATAPSRAFQLVAAAAAARDEECAICKAEAGAPCVYSTNPPIARDQMHYQRYEAGEAHRAARRAHGDNV